MKKIFTKFFSWKRKKIASLIDFLLTEMTLHQLSILATVQCYACIIITVCVNIECWFLHCYLDTSIPRVLVLFNVLMFMYWLYCNEFYGIIENLKNKKK